MWLPAAELFHVCPLIVPNNLVELSEAVPPLGPAGHVIVSEPHFEEG